ncbi:MAG: hypothetical protein ABSH36_14260 [Solirubrobacteraceae bacterium]
MPVETIKCQECGSADVTEFKVGTYVCGHCEAIFKHVDPSGTATCLCGTFAVGRCAECHIPICSDCSRLVGSLRLCSEHALAATTKATKARWATESAARLQRAADGQRLAEEAKQKLRLIEDPYERLCVALKELMHERPRTPFGKDQGRSGLPGDLLAEICPELWSSPPIISDFVNDPPWDGSAIARWFAKRATDAGMLPNDEYDPETWSRPFLGKRTKDPAMPCWRFRRSSTQTYGRRVDERTREDACILSDGRIAVRNGLARPGNLTADALIAMASRLETARPDGSDTNVHRDHQVPGVRLD